MKIPSKVQLHKFIGITLIEVTIAIIVFGTGVVVVMGMIVSNISWLYDIKEKDTAIAIAKEGIDIVYHLRDSNLERGLYWNCSYMVSDGDRCGGRFLDDPTVSSYIIDWEKDDIDWAAGEQVYYLTGFVSTGQDSLRYHTGVVYTQGATDYEGFWFNHDSVDGESTIFSRTIEFRPLTGYQAYTGYVLELTSRVKYNRGANEKEISLQSIIGYTR